MKLNNAIKLGLGDHNNLVIQFESDLIKTDVYTLFNHVGGKVKHLLGFDLRSVNGREELHYDLGDGILLVNYLENNKLTDNEVINLCINLLNCYEECINLSLPDGGILFEVQGVVKNNGNFRFVYTPFSNQDASNRDYQSLLDMLVKVCGREISNDLYVKLSNLTKDDYFDIQSTIHQLESLKTVKKVELTDSMNLNVSDVKVDLSLNNVMSNSAEKVVVEDGPQKTRFGNMVKPNGTTVNRPNANSTSKPVSPKKVDKKETIEVSEEKSEGINFKLIGGIILSFVVAIGTFIVNPLTNSLVTIFGLPIAVFVLGIALTSILSKNNGKKEKKADTTDTSDSKSNFKSKVLTKEITKPNSKTTSNDIKIQSNSNLNEDKGVTLAKMIVPEKSNETIKPISSINEEGKKSSMPLPSVQSIKPISYETVAPKIEPISQITKNISSTKIMYEEDSEATEMFTEIIEDANPRFEFSVNGETKSFEIYKDKFLVGRSGEHLDYAFGKECTKISKIHAEFALQQGRLLLMDMGSTNGTFVYESKEKLESKRYVELHDGDVVWIANIKGVVRF